MSAAQSHCHRRAEDVKFNLLVMLIVWNIVLWLWALA